MTNLDFITPQLATGGDLPPNRNDAVRVLQEWRALGITHVVDNRFEWNDDDLVAEHCPEITTSTSASTTPANRCPTGGSTSAPSGSEAPSRTPTRRSSCTATWGSTVVLRSPTHACSCSVTTRSRR
jgi:hypothetical protein